MVSDIDKKKIRNVVRKTCTERIRMGLLKDLMFWEVSEESDRVS